MTTASGAANEYSPTECDQVKHSESAVQQNSCDSRNKRKTTGIAFSGGGIRSAAFCSGALRRILQDDVPFEYLSCVSGGGYTGAAFMEWKYRQGPRNDTKEWHKEFFERMRANTGYMCNWQKSIVGICQSLMLFCLLLVVVLILPCVLWLLYALPITVSVDFMFGEILRERPICPPGVNQSSRHSVLMMELYESCQPPFRRVVLFITTAAGSPLCFFLSRRRCLLRYRGPFRLLSILSGLVLVFTLFPWFAHDILWPREAWIRVLIAFVGIVFPFFFPIIRKSAAIFFVFYAYTYVLSWKIFRKKLFDAVPYSDEVFYPVLMVYSLVFGMFPFIGSLHQSLFNIYYRLVCT